MKTFRVRHGSWSKDVCALDHVEAVLRVNPEAGCVRRTVTHPTNPRRCEIAGIIGADHFYWDVEELEDTWFQDIRPHLLGRRRGQHVLVRFRGFQAMNEDGPEEKNFRAAVMLTGAVNDIESARINLERAKTNTDLLERIWLILEETKAVLDALNRRLEKNCPKCGHDKANHISETGVCLACTENSNAGFSGECLRG